MCRPEQRVLLGMWCAGGEGVRLGLHKWSLRLRTSDTNTLDANQTAQFSAECTGR